ncbi:hypothetical protein [Peromfec virus RodF8_20]|uniref:Uncharacterized protein n=1 Tax=Peromfec virus RodF8_20 TaxID=2929362 RepID=A0A976N1V6_9VIRU|nr:hypothetical protein [Peromfec virus RodF8_20]
MQSRATTKTSTLVNWIKFALKWLIFYFIVVPLMEVIFFRKLRNMRRSYSHLVNTNLLSTQPPLNVDGNYIQKLSSETQTDKVSRRTYSI